MDLPEAFEASLLMLAVGLPEAFEALSLMSVLIVWQVFETLLLMLVLIGRFVLALPAEPVSLPGLSHGHVVGAGLVLSLDRRVARGHEQDFFGSVVWDCVWGWSGG